MNDDKIVSYRIKTILFHTITYSDLHNLQVCRITVQFLPETQI